MSALPPKADIVQRNRHGRFLPKADIGRYGHPTSRRVLRGSRGLRDVRFTLRKQTSEVGLLGSVQQLQQLGDIRAIRAPRFLIEINVRLFCDT